MKQPCANCPWRKENHGKRTPWGFYTAKNLRRLWGGVRKGNPQSCHPTDPSHPDHVASGTKLGAQVQECPGAVILVLRELRVLQAHAEVIEPEHVIAYLQAHPDGLTKDGIMYWLVQRIVMAGVPFVGGRRLPEVDEEFPACRM